MGTAAHRLVRRAGRMAVESRVAGSSAATMGMGSVGVAGSRVTVVGTRAAVEGIEVHLLALQVDMMVVVERAGAAQMVEGLKVVAGTVEG